MTLEGPEVKRSFDDRDLSGWKITGEFVFCTFDRANLHKADLTSGVFVDVKFRNADLSGANLCGCTLVNVDFTGATITCEQIRCASRLQNVTGPDGQPCQ